MLVGVHAYTSISFFITALNDTLPFASFIAFSRPYVQTRYISTILAYP